MLSIKRLKSSSFGHLFFLLTAIILEAPQIASRDLAAQTEKSKYQQLTGISPTAHSSICARLNRIPTIAMDQLLTQAHQYVSSRIHTKGLTLPQMKGFDTSTWSVTQEQFEWAAHNGKRAAARFVLVMNYKTSLPERLIDASTSTSDNDVFYEVIRQTRPGMTWVFDRGYSRLSTIKEIITARGHFITRWNASYAWTLVKRRKIRANTFLPDGWVIIADEIGWVGAKSNAGRALYRRITCQHSETGKLFRIFTDLRKPRAAKLVRMYVQRWPIEVTFRHIKSSLGIIHFPVRSPEGVHNWLVLIALSLIWIHLLGTSKPFEPNQGLMSSHYPFRLSRRRVQILIENEMFALRCPPSCLFSPVDSPPVLSIVTLKTPKCAEVVL